VNTVENPRLLEDGRRGRRERRKEEHTDRCTTEKHTTFI